jgi:tRNA threonylcarbamoyladenosine biosynthesis protein TsaE
MSLRSRSPEDTRKLGAELGELLRPGDTVALAGVLGSGKSVLARGVLQALGIRGSMPSPSFVIIAAYRGRLPVNHIDLYRLKGEEEASAVGLEEELHSGAVNVIEWADRAPEMLPTDRIDVDIATGEGPEDRVVTLRPTGPEAAERLEPLARRTIRRSLSEYPGD